ncbi:hypothetical protein [Burkholderia sp. WSM2230]|uniref:hypothetical protein n=1 Tax=Burkholderia sp. WSM2230 TaxID=944435 RepID=UPI0003F75F0E|nr:hypothetical protein [Burkholderia sp. WSM2230]
MSTQTLAGHQFPTPCKRCGGALYRQLEHCPYCGAVHPLDDEAPARSALHESRTSTLKMSTLHDSFTASAFAEPDFPGGALHAGLNLAPAAALHTSPSPLVAPDTSLMPVIDTDRGELAHRTSLHLRHVLLASAAVVAAGLAYVGYALLSESRDLHYSSGEQAAETAQNARTATGAIARYSPEQAAESRLAVVPGKSIGAGSVRNTPQAVPATVPIVVAAAQPAAPQFHDAAQAVQAARTAFAVNDLSAAQAALSAVQVLQPDNDEAQALAARLKPLTARRDAALLAAQLCTDQQSWPCAREHANEALALDTGSDPAKTILERVIRETGWAPLSAQTTTSAKIAGQVAKQ